MSKLTSLLAGVAIVPVLALSAPAFAQEAPTGQIEGGNIYRVANVTKGSDFVDPATAACGETVQFRVRIHNIGAYAAENVKVTATMPTAAATSHSSMITVKGSNTNSVTDTAGVNLATAGKLTYVAGSTELLDANQSKLGNLADGIIGAGVTLPDAIGVSTQQKRSVQFQAKVTCDTPPTTPPETPETPETPGTPEVPSELPNTGAGDVVALVAAVTVAGAVAHRVVLSRRS